MKQEHTALPFKLVYQEPIHFSLKKKASIRLVQAALKALQLAGYEITQKGD